MHVWEFCPVCSITKIYLLPDLVLFRSFRCSRTRLDSLNRKKQYSNSSENDVVPWISLSPCHCTQYFIRFSSWIFLSSFDVFRAVGEGHAAPAQPLVGRGARGRRHEDGRAQGLGVDVLVASPCVDDIKFYKIMYNTYIYIIYVLVVDIDVVDVLDVLGGLCEIELIELVQHVSSICSNHMQVCGEHIMKSSARYFKDGYFV